MEPMFSDIYELHPQLDLGDINVVICRNTMAKLLELIKRAEGFKAASALRQGDKAEIADATSLLHSGDMLAIGEKRPTTGHRLVIRSGGTTIDQGAVIEIKTRAAHKTLDLESVLPRLWTSQTPNLIVAYHRGGRFDDVQVLDLSNDLKKWEERNSGNLHKLDAVIQRIIHTVRKSVTRKYCVKRTDNGKLGIWELDTGHQSTLPDDLSHKLREEANPEVEKDD
ncbi:MAG: hypothetical protein Q9217_000590 [Psora testacea]